MTPPRYGALADILHDGNASCAIWRPVIRLNHRQRCLGKVTRVDQQFLRNEMRDE